MNYQLKLFAPALAGLLALSGCGSEPEPEATESPITQMGEMGETTDMPMAQRESGILAAKSTGTITAIDTGAGKVTLDHAAIPEAEWPAMTMAFDADPELLDNFAVGDKAAFDVQIAGSSGRVTAITKE